MPKYCLMCAAHLKDQLTLEWFFSLKKVFLPQICSNCAKQLSKITKPICPGCGCPSSNLCMDCQNWQKQGYQLLNNRSLYCYQSAMMKEIFRQYKFLGAYHLRHLFQKQFSQFILANYPLKAGWQYCLIPVDEATFQKRQFNQVQGLVKVPLLDCLKIKTGYQKQQQSHKSKKDRLKTTQPFAFFGSDLFEAKIVLIDDIYTTGRTLYHAQTVLLAHGASVVKSVTLCR